MQGLPKTIDLTPLVWREIQEISAHKFGAQLSFDIENPRISIGIESSEVIFTDSNGIATKIDDLRTKGGVLLLLLGLTVESATRREDGGLTLDMSSSIRVEVINDSPMYEVLQLQIGDNLIVG